MRIGHGTAILGCGRITHEPGSAFGVGFPIPIIQTGGRVTRSYPEMTISEAAMSLRPSGNVRGLAAFLRRIDVYAAQARSEFGVIQAEAMLLETPRLENTFVGRSCRIDSATRLTDCVILSEPEHPVLIEDGAVIVESAIQWGSQVKSLSIVEGSLLCEYSQVEKHGKVIQSILGPNTIIAEGEVTSSLVGPFVGFHHQALLIGAVWPEGKGNIGYGCNCGSNHTGKAPDQEFWPGEGMFLGLGVNVKYPGCFTESPYTFVATGTTLPPQNVAFPFSLITNPSDLPEGLSGDMNEIIPGWVLRNNLFAIKRNERKFKSRDRSFRYPIEYRILREDIVQMMLAAREHLQHLAEALSSSPYKRGGEVCYTGDHHLSQLGKNFLTERSRQRAIATYSFHIQLYALEGLHTKISSKSGRNGSRTALTGRYLDSPSLLKRSSATPGWEFQRRLLIQEGMLGTPRELLLEYLKRLKILALEVEESKARDDQRGIRIIPDYEDHHVMAKANPFVLEYRNEVDELEEEILDLLDI
jgi:hypothetical protein